MYPDLNNFNKIKRNGGTAIYQCGGLIFKICLNNLYLNKFKYPTQYIHYFIYQTTANH